MCLPSFSKVIQVSVLIVMTFACLSSPPHVLRETCITDKPEDISVLLLTDRIAATSWIRTAKYGEESCARDDLYYTWNPHVVTVTILSILRF